MLRLIGGCPMLAIMLLSCLLPRHFCCELYLAFFVHTSRDKPSWHVLGRHRNLNPCLKRNTLSLPTTLARCSSDDEDEKTEERRTFKRDFLALLKARVFQARESGRGVILVGVLAGAQWLELPAGVAVNNYRVYHSSTTVTKDGIIECFCSSMV